METESAALRGEKKKGKNISSERGAPGLRILRFVFYVTIDVVIRERISVERFSSDA